MAPLSIQRAGANFAYLIRQLQKAVIFDTAFAHQSLIQHCILSIQAEETIFKNAILQLLGSDKPFDLVDWLAADTLLKSKLGAHYVVYNDCIERVLASVATLVVLTLLYDGETDATSICQPGPQFQFPTWDWTEDRYDRLLIKVLDVDNSIMKEINILYDANQKLISIEPDRGRNSGKEFSGFEDMRLKASTAASILGPDSGFHCPCHQDHMAFIKIPDRPGFRGQENENHFSLLFQNLAQNSKWKYIEMSSYITEVDDQDERKESTRNKGGVLQQVRFEKKSETEEEATSHVTINMPAETIKGIMSQSNPVEFSGSSNLCHHIGLYHEEIDRSASSKFILAAPGLRLRMAPTKTSGSRPPPHTLEEHFSGRGNQSLTAVERLELSTQVASVVLCLYSTPWLSESWSSTDIYFRHYSDHVQLNPWTVKSVSINRVSEVAPTPFDRTIFSLGRFLVSLWFGAPWSSVRNVYASSTKPEATEESKDRRVIEMILEWASDETLSPNDRPFFEEGRLYANAVRNCLDCDFGQTKSSMTDKIFREGVYKNILLPLRLAMDNCLNAQVQLFGAALQDSIPNRTLGKPLKTDATLFDDDRHVDRTKDSITDAWFESYVLKVKKVAKSLRQNRQTQPDQRIRVAVLDTGVDIQDPFLNPFAIKRQIIYQDFSSPGSSSGVPEDKVGHGTHICGTLLTIADNIDVYVARVSVHGKDWDGLQIAKAIKWAVEEKKVHIISISFGFNSTGNQQKQLDPIRRAILQANAADILIFAAASNDGGNRPVAFPARMDEVICVGSTDGMGNRSGFTPHLQQGKRLCTVGERIESSWPPHLLSDDEDAPRRSGTSFATPVAAGVAALVLDYMWTFKDVKAYKALIPKLRTRRGMLSVFQHMVVPYSDSHDYLVPWQLFNSDVNGDLDESESEDDDDVDMTAKDTAEESREKNAKTEIRDKILGTLRLL